MINFHFTLRNGLLFHIKETQINFSFFNKETQLTFQITIGISGKFSTLTNALKTSVKKIIRIILLPYSFTHCHNCFMWLVVIGCLSLSYKFTIFFSITHNLPRRTIVTKCVKILKLCSYLRKPREKKKSKAKYTNVSLVGEAIPILFSFGR